MRKSNANDEVREVGGGADMPLQPMEDHTGADIHDATHREPQALQKVAVP